MVAQGASSHEPKSDGFWDCVVVGAGIAGLTARRLISQAGYGVLTLEKSRGLGGRMATRRFSSEGEGSASAPHGVVDLGAQFVSVRGADFRALVRDADCAAIRLPWDPGHVRYVPKAGMNSLAKGLLGSPAASEEVAPLLRDTRVTGFEWDLDHGYWRVATEKGVTYCTRSVLLTAPLPQSVELLMKSGIAAQNPMEHGVTQVRYTVCLAAILQLYGVEKLPPPGLLKNVSPDIAGLFDQKQKGLATGIRMLVVHAGPEYSRKNWSHPEKDVLADLWKLSRKFVQGSVPEANDRSAARLSMWGYGRSPLQRWRYCEPVAPLPLPYLRWSAPGPLYLAGDAFRAARVEGAFESGQRAAAALLEELS